MYQWFSNPESWNDPFEKYFLNNSFKDKDCPLKDHVAVACFTTKTASEAQWTVYSNKELAVQIRFGWDGLVAGLKDYKDDDHLVYIGKVQYIDTRTITKKELSKVLGVSDDEIQQIKDRDPYELYARLLSVKRPAFSYEEEIRIMIVSIKNEIKDGLNIGPFNKKKIDCMTVSPHAGNETFKVLKTAFMQRGLSRVYHSKLYDPVVNIVLE